MATTLQQQSHPELSYRRASNLNMLRVLTLNVWGRHGAWTDRRVVLIDGLRSLNPDLIAFQEAINSADYDQIADVLGPEYYVVHQGGRGADGSGASIASRWPVRNLREVDLHVTPRVDPTVGWIGSLVVAEIPVPDPIGPVVFVHHKPTWQWGFERERELQAVAAARFVEEVVGERPVHVVLAGDFDAPPEAASMRFWRGRQSLEGMSVCYQDAWERLHPGEVGHTFTPSNPLVATGEMPLERGRRIDHILVRCGNHGPTLDVARCMLAFNAPVNGVWASDHFGVVADLTVLA
jgi:endonuclease/exonuclease/phosphatase family metal-dependent hydrolase